MIHSFGREDELDRAAIVRLIGSLQRVLEPGEALEAATDAELRFVESRPMGGALVLDGLWRRLGIDTVMSALLEGRRLDPGAERVLFALVANRALEPLSKLSATGWVRERAWIDGLDDVTDDACYRAMDWLLEIEQQLCERVYWQTADLLNLEVDLLFFDTTSTYFDRSRRRTGRRRGRDRDARVSVSRAFQGPPSRLAAGPHRDGRHADGNPDHRSSMSSRPARAW